MRLLAITLLMLSFSIEPLLAQEAQKEGRTSYRGSLVKSAPLYNTGTVSSYSTGGPIALNQLLRGNNAAANGSRQYAYSGQQTFGAKDYSLSLSPDQVRANRARQEANYQRQQRELQQQARQQERLAAQSASQNSVQGQTNQFLNQFQSPNAQAIQTSSGASQRRVVRRPSGFETPKKVFNSVR